MAAAGVNPSHYARIDWTLEGVNPGHSARIEQTLAGVNPGHPARIDWTLAGVYPGHLARLTARFRESTRVIHHDRGLVDSRAPGSRARGVSAGRPLSLLRTEVECDNQGVATAGRRERCGAPWFARHGVGRGTTADTPPRSLQACCTTRHPAFSHRVGTARGTPWDTQQTTGSVPVVDIPGHQ